MDATGFVKRRGGVVVEARREEALHLLDAAFVKVFRLHDFVDDRNVERHDRDGGAGLRDEGFVDGNDGASVAMRLERGVEFLGGAVEVVFRHADGAVFVDGPGDFGADVGVGDGGRAGGEDVGGEEGVDPHFPVFAAHDGDGVGDFGVGGGVDGDGGDGAFVGVDGFRGVGRADGFEGGFVDGAGHGVLAARGGEGVDDEVDLAEFGVGFDGVDDLLFDGGGEGVAVNVFGVETGGAGGVGEGDGVIPAGGGGASVVGGAFVENAEGGGVGAEGGGDARGESEAGGGADDEDFFRAVFERRFRPDVVDLLLDVRGAAGRVRRDADEAANLGFDDHGHSSGRDCGASAGRQDKERGTVALAFRS